jgi:8-oxo-dGTP diphosphatase
MKWERSVEIKESRSMPAKFPRVAVRAIIVEDGRMLLVNAWNVEKSPLMCAPGGGVELGSSLPDNLMREVFEETGLTISVGAPCLVNEYHDALSRFHQIELFFRCEIVAGSPRPEAWSDSENVVTERRWLTRAELATIPHKPDSLASVAFDESAISYDPLEQLVT